MNEDRGVDGVDSINCFLFKASTWYSMSNENMAILKDIIEAEVKIKVHDLSEPSRSLETFNYGRTLWSNPDSPFINPQNAGEGKMFYHVLATQDISDGFDIIRLTQERAAAAEVEAERVSKVATNKAVQRRLVLVQEALKEIMAEALETQADADALTGPVDVPDGSKNDEEPKKDKKYKKDK